jgi:hypothetical protein
VALCAFALAVAAWAIGRDSPVSDIRPLPPESGRDSEVDRELATLRARMADLEREQRASRASSPLSTPAQVVTPAQEPESSVENDGPIAAPSFSQQVQSHFDALDIDAELSDSMEGHLVEAMEDFPEVSEGTHVRNVSCAASMCRVQVAHEDPMSGARFREASAATIFRSSQSGHLIPGDGETTVYLSNAPDGFDGIATGTSPR